jgi:energy-coupling factor transporter ATP-binding protein EcfA2
MSDEFADLPAVRGDTPLLVGLVGPSSSGKTYSALRLAAGIARVSEGETFVVDTEAKRALHYAEKFQFRHVVFRAPFGPLRYLAAIEHCMTKAASRSKKKPTIIVDSQSHEHEGEGGVLDMHEAELEKRCGDDWKKRERLTMLCWAKPKAERQRLIGAILQMEANFIFCFRAKPKLKLERGKEPESLGYQPISGDNFIYEMTLKCLLLPGANGIPTWQSDMIGERAMIKLPEQFRTLFSANPPPQLTEDIGEQLARWAAGVPPVASTNPLEIEARLASCADPATFRALQAESRSVWKTLSAEQKERIKTAVNEAETRLATAQP